MKKLTLSITLLLLFSTFLFAQEIKQKDKLNEETKAVKVKHGIRSVGDKVLFKDGSTVLMEIENEGSAGSIVLPDVEGGLSGTKLYNWGGNLFWGGNQLGTAGSLGGWTRTGTYVHLTNNGDFVGIGTTNPNAKLDLQMSGTGFWQSGIRLLNYDLEAGNQLMFTLGADDVTKNAANIYFTYQGDGSSQNRLSLGLHSVDDVLNIMADGNVGIGTTTPGQKLTLPYDSYIGWEHTSSNHNVSYKIGHDATSAGPMQFMTSFNPGETKPVFSFFTYSTEVFTMLKNGNVGIGTTSPGAKLEVAGQLKITGGSPGAGKVLTSDATGLASWETSSSGSGNTLDEAYDQGGAGTGRTITADAGAVTVAGVDGLLSTGAFGSGTIPAEGAGTRMMWYPAKAAFRAGRVTGTIFWDADSIGEYSFASGNNTIANGTGSTAMGYNTRASGLYSTAMGFNTRASGWYSTAMGYQTTASDYYSTAMGSNTTASGTGSTAMGYQTTASGYYSTAMGREIEANGDGTVAIGLSDQNGLVVTQDNTMAIMGGNVGIGTTSPSEMLEVAGQLKITGGSPGAGKVLTSDATGLASWEGGYSIGDEAQGGIVFYVDASGKHGLACPTTDQSTGIKWSKTYTDILAYASSVGGGHLNTKLIVKDQGSSGDNYAALLCDGLSHDSYNDWYLPSKYELDLMYTNLHLEGLGGFASNNYWSSTEYSNILAWLQSFHMGTQDNYGKSEIRYVRAVRAF